MRPWGGTHRCVSERSPLRAFLEMEPISLSSMKLWREGGLRGRPSVPCCGPRVLGETRPVEAIGHWNVLKPPQKPVLPKAPDGHPRSHEPNPMLAAKLTLNPACTGSWPPTLPPVSPLPPPPTSITTDTQASITIPNPSANNMAATLVNARRCHHHRCRPHHSLPSSTPTPSSPSLTRQY